MTPPRERRSAPRPPRALPASLLALALALAFGACETPRNKVEILDAPADNGNSVRVACSDESYMVFRKLVEGNASRLGVRFEIFPTQSENVLDMLSKGTVHVGVTSRAFTGDSRVAALSYVPFAFDGAVFLASEDAGVRSLTRAQLRDILSGRTTRWSEVGGADREIRIIARPDYSSVSIALGDALFDGKFPAPRKNYLLETSDGAYQAMKTLNSCLAYAPMSRTMIERFPAVPLTIDGMPPLLSNVPYKKYPGKIEYGMFFRKDAPAAVKDLAGFLVSVDGMHRVTAAGLAPASDVLPLSACHCRATEGTFAPKGKLALAGTFTIAVVPERGAIEQESRYARLSQYIAEELGVRMHLRHLESYERVLSEFHEGRIDAAFVGSYVYAQLHAQMGILPVARPMSRGNAQYRGLVIVRAGSRSRRFEDLRGRSFAYVASTSAGELFTKVLARRIRENPARFFSRLHEVATHTEAVSLVETGKADGAAVKDVVFAKMISSAPALRDAFRVIEVSPTFPENALVVSPSMDAAQRKRLQDILLSCDGDDRGRKALKALGAERFLVTTDEDYGNLYALARETGTSFAAR